MSYLSPTTLTQAEQRTILRATAKSVCDHTIISLALGTGLRLGEIVGLDVGDIYNPNGRPQTRICIRPHIAKRGKAGFERLYPFHCARHTAVTNVYRMTRDLFLAQRFARHVSPLTTTIYTHPSDQEMAARLRGLGC